MSVTFKSTRSKKGFSLLVSFSKIKFAESFFAFKWKRAAVKKEMADWREDNKTELEPLM